MFGNVIIDWVKLDGAKEVEKLSSRCGVSERAFIARINLIFLNFKLVQENKTPPANKSTFKFKRCVVLANKRI